MTLARRLLLLALLSVLPAVAIWGFTEVALRREREAEVKDLALRQARLAASELERIFQGVRSVLTAIGEMPAIQSLDAPACAAYLAELAAEGPASPHHRRDRIGRAAPSARNQPLTADRERRRPPYFQRGDRDGRVHDRRVHGGAGEPAGGAALRAAAPGRATDGSSAWSRPPSTCAGSAASSTTGRCRRAARSPSPTAPASSSPGSRSRSASSARAFRRAFDISIDAAEPGALEVVSQDGVRRVLGYVPARLPPNGLYVSAGLSASTAYARHRRQRAARPRPDRGGGSALALPRRARGAPLHHPAVPGHHRGRACLASGRLRRPHRAAAPERASSASWPRPSTS